MGMNWAPRREQNKGGVLGNLGSPKREQERTNKSKKNQQKVINMSIDNSQKLIHILFILFLQLNIIVSKLN